MLEKRAPILGTHGWAGPTLHGAARASSGGDFKERFESNEQIALHELLYPFAPGSYELEVGKKLRARLRVE